jgi:uncharacterized membrane protein
MTRKKIILLASAGGVVILSAGAVAAVLFWPWGEPKPASDKPEDIVKFMAQEDFSKLSDAKQQEYFNKLSANGPPWAAFQAGRNLSEAQREQLHQNMRPMMERRMEQHMDEFFALPPEKRNEFLDRQIDRMQQGFGRGQRPQGSENPPREARPDGRGGSGRHGRGGFTPERMKRMLERTSPERRAKFVEFMKAMRKRMQERGIESPSGPPGHRH